VQGQQVHYISSGSIDDAANTGVKERTMTRRWRIVCMTMIACLPLACADHRPGRTEALSDRSRETEELLLSAERGTAEDQYALGTRYEQGIGVLQSYPEAVRWYRLAAMHDYPDALYKLCEMSERGQGLPQDYQEALRWCGLAADHGHGRAMFMLGRLYHTGHGVPLDVVRAHMWYNLATANGYDEGKRWRDRIADEMSPSQIAEAQKLAREWSVRMSSRNG
jgi:TPR repeat protein